MTTPEVLYALESGHIAAIGRVACYEKDVIFHEYVTSLYELRVRYIGEGNEIMGWCCKILMNSLFGKFGQRGYVFDIIDKCDPGIVAAMSEIDAETGIVYKIRQYAGIVEQMRREGESQDSHPAIAAHVTGYARMLLWRYMLKAGRENIFYNDTDSLWVNKLGYDNLAGDIEEGALGSS